MKRWIEICHTQKRTGWIITRYLLYHKIFTLSQDTYCITRYLLYHKILTLSQDTYSITRYLHVHVLYHKILTLSQDIYSITRYLLLYHYVQSLLNVNSSRLLIIVLSNAVESGKKRIITVTNLFIDKNTPVPQWVLYLGYVVSDSNSLH